MLKLWGSAIVLAICVAGLAYRPAYGQPMSRAARPIEAPAKLIIEQQDEPTRQCRTEWPPALIAITSTSEATLDTPFEFGLLYLDVMDTIRGFRPAQSQATGACVRATRSRDMSVRHALFYRSGVERCSIPFIESCPSRRSPGN
ncbi:hypothetical protein [Burkholderia stagnalis]